jgi:hypothetical protein
MMDFGEATEDAAAGQERLNKAFDNARASQQRNLDFLSQEKLLLLEQKKLAEGRTEDTKQDIEERNRIIAAGLQNQITLTVLALKREEDAVKKAKAAELEAFRTGSEEQQKAASEALDKAEQRRAESAQKQKDLLNEQKIFALQSANELSSFDIDAQDKASQAAEEAAKKREQLSEDELRLRQEIAQRSVELTNQQILLEETLLNEASDARLKGFLVAQFIDDWTELSADDRVIEAFFRDLGILRGIQVIGIFRIALGRGGETEAERPFRAKNCRHL